VGARTAGGRGIGRRIPRLGAAVVLVAMLVTACSSGPEPVSGPRVLLVGDSILTGANSTVADALRARGWDPVVRALPGTKIVDWAKALPQVVAEVQPNVAVVELGTNDCPPDDCRFLDAYIDEVMAALTSTADAVLWLNAQQDVTVTFLTENNWNYVNAAIQSADVRWQNMFLVDMNTRLAGHPEWHQPDGVHLNAAGNEQLATLIADALEPFRPAA